MWRDVLRLAAVGRDDDFFDLGGDSLLAGKVLTGLRARTGADVGLRLLFEHTRLADLAAALPAAADESAAVVTPRDPDAEPVLSFEQQRAWLESMIRPATAYNVHGRRLLRGQAGRRGAPAMRTRDHRPARHAAHELPARPRAARATGRRAGRGPGPPARRYLGRAGPGRCRRPPRRRPGGHDVRPGRRAAVRLPAGTAGRRRVPASITIHHIVSDGWSIGLFVRELSALYQAGGDTGRAGLPALPVQYLDYAAWQRNRSPARGWRHGWPAGGTGWPARHLR